MRKQIRWPVLYSFKLSNCAKVYVTKWSLSNLVWYIDIFMI